MPRGLYDPVADPPEIFRDFRESYNFLNRITHLVPGIIYVFNHRTRSNEYSNRSLAELLGYTPQELIAMGDRLIERCVHEDDLPGLTAYFARIANLSDGEYAQYEYRDYAKNGSIVWLRSIDTVFERDGEGRCLRHIGVASDITAEKEAEQRLEAMNHDLERTVEARTRALAELNADLERRVGERTAELRRMNRELEQLTYVATHDLRVPVNNMCGLAVMLNEARDLLPEEHQETLDWLGETCVQARGTLDALVQVAQMSALGEGKDRETFRIGDALGSALAVLDADISFAGATVENRIDPGTTAFFVKSIVEDALEAFIHNAITYVPSDRAPHVIVASETQGSATRLSVSDNGTGLDVERDAVKVFSLFQRAHLDPPGAGVALYCLRSRVESLGGTIELESSLGAGSTFTLVIPGAET